MHLFPHFPAWHSGFVLYGEAGWMPVAVFS
jgi:hypothetical protein